MEIQTTKYITFYALNTYIFSIKFGNILKDVLLPVLYLAFNDK